MRSLNIHDLAQVCGGFATSGTSAQHAPGHLVHDPITINSPIFGGPVHGVPGVLESDPITSEGPGRAGPNVDGGLPMTSCPIAIEQVS